VTIVKTLLLVILFFLAVTFSLQNADQVTIRYYGLVESIVAPLFSVVLASVLLGIIIGALGSIVTNVKLRRQIRKQTKETERLRQQSSAPAVPDVPSRDSPPAAIEPSQE
jgi:uncharacterized integral membrane protein